MGFKSRDKKNANKDASDSDAAKSVKTGEEPCGINGCEGWSDKSFGGRSLSVDDAEDCWGSNYTVRKGRVRVCKSCYRHWKKDSKKEDSGY